MAEGGSQRLADERERLIDLQRMLLPSTLPELGCTEAASVYRAHNHDFRIGGDWYDLIDKSETNQVVAIVGDVVGHGVEQISVMGQLRAASNALSRRCDDPAELLASLDGFAIDHPGATLATLVVMMLDGSGEGTLARAGHPPPIVVSPDGSVRILDIGQRPPLTVAGAGRSARFSYAVDDVIVLYTDGAIGRRDQDIDVQIDALGQFVKEHRAEPCRAIADAIVDGFVREVDDDITVLVLRPHDDRSPSHRLEKVVGSPSTRFV